MAPSLASKIEAANSTILAAGNLDRIDEFFAPSYVAHLTDRDMAKGRDGVRTFVAALRRCFTDLQVEVEILVEGRDRVAWQRTLRATHKRAYKGFPASGEPIVWRDMVTSRFQGGLIAEDWSMSDLAERLLLARKH